jgi:hypothetical protein
MYLIGWLIGWRRTLQALSRGGSTILPRCRHRVSTVHSFLKIPICICLGASTSCKIKKGKLLTNQTTIIVDITITTKLVRAAEQVL